VTSVLECKDTYFKIATQVLMMLMTKSLKN
jgi:hypothetical protein